MSDGGSGANRSRRRWKSRTAAVLAIAVGALAYALWATRGAKHVRRPFSPPPPSFSGSSAQLKQTVIVPTLDSPIPKAKNAIWCATFQLAWERLSKDVFSSQAITVEGAEEVADRLNRSKDTSSILPDGDFYAGAGMLKDGSIERIQREFLERFPGSRKPEFAASGTGPGAVAYGYLRSAVPFTIPYFENDEPLAFKSSNGKSAAVHSFGIRKKDEYAYEELRKQPAVLFTGGDFIGGADGMNMSEYGIDLCKDSDIQVVAAVLKRGPTLLQTLHHIDDRIKEGPMFGSRIIANDVLLVPNLSWRIDHRFAELENKPVKNAPLTGMPIVEAAQSIDFRLDRSGAELASEAKVYVAPVPHHYLFDRPFLVYLKKRGADLPFFVAWIDNPELLSPVQTARTSTGRTTARSGTL